jgi:hypothetical protein
MLEHGFEDAACERLSLGIVAMHSARMPLEMRDAQTFAAR